MPRTQQRVQSCSNKNSMELSLTKKAYAIMKFKKAIYLCLGWTNKFGGDQPSLKVAGIPSLRRK